MKFSITSTRKKWPFDKGDCLIEVITADATAARAGM
jgi:hypothetical protein